MSEAQAMNVLKGFSKDYYGGALMALLGVGAIWKGLDYEVGTLTRMGPGFFPVGVGAVLALMGLLIATGARSSAPEVAGRKSRRPEWRGWLCIILGNVAFIVVGRYGGLLPASFLIVFISALGDRENTFGSALMLALAMVAVCVVVFWWALRLQFPLFRWG
ncbi:hypothetical protein FEP08_03250 [Burkholderia multivorans]|nr:hypothetical protein [Burkholderia multivorans]